MKARVYTTIVFFIISFAIAQKKPINKTTSTSSLGYELVFNSQNCINETLQLSMVYGTNKKKLVTDSIVIKNANQKVVFKESKKIVGAIYQLGLKSNPNNHIELALDNGSKVNGSLPNTNTQSWIIESNQLNVDFLAYQRATKTDALVLRNELIKKYPNSVLQIYLWAENKIALQKPNSLIEQEAYYTAFFDEVQPSEKRLAFLPNINKLLYKFVTAKPITNENYIKHIDKLLKGLDCKTQNFTIFIKYLAANLSFFESNNLEASYNHLYEKYIKDNTCKVFSANDMNKFSNEYDTNKKVPLLTVFPQLSFVKKDSTALTIQEIYTKNDYTLLTFFSPTCQHCIDKMPEIKKFMDNLKEKFPAKNTQWVTILNDRDENKWIEFLEKNQLEQSAINLKSLDPNRSYQYSLNAYSNPSYFLLDKDGKVVLKSFNNKAILEIINK
jgi:thiol-disulfide isomerase/thioredoxin